MVIAGTELLGNRLAADSTRLLEGTRTQLVTSKVLTRTELWNRIILATTRTEQLNRTNLATTRS